MYHNNNLFHNKFNPNLLNQLKLEFLNNQVNNQVNSHHNNNNNHNNQDHNNHPNNHNIIELYDKYKKTYIYKYIYNLYH